jgi:tetratricopeptide (TPR) repeat protein
MKTPKINVSQLTLYNPARLTDAEILAAFVARKAVFERVLSDVVEEKPDSRPQHHLIVGQRGMGKSTLLMRLAAELRTSAKLSKRFVPLVFAEEQYAVDRLSKFWLNCLDSLADATERGGDFVASERIDAVVRTLKHQTGGTAEKDETAARAALEAFQAATESVAKRPVLLVDNLQLVFERIAPVEQHALRELLMRPGSPIVFGASPSPPPETQGYGAAFYDHFKVHYLRALSADEMRELMLRLADSTDRADVRKNVIAHPERLKTLRDLTGGNPRTVVALFFLYAEDFSPSVFADLENLLDRVTPLYKARIEELAEQQQVLVSAIADAWAPITARAIAEATGLPVASISAQLDRLEKIGFVEKVEIFDQSSTGYQIAERFLNVWFLMRSASRRQRREVEFLVRFIESFYEAHDRPRLARHLMSERDLSPDRFQFAKALASTLDPNDSEELVRHAELDALRQKAADTRRKMEEVVDFSKLPRATLAFDDLRERLMALVPDGLAVSPEHFADEVLGDRRMFMRGERERLATSAGKLSEEKINTILKSIVDARKQDELQYGGASAAWFSRRLATGQLRSVNDRDDWNRLFLRADEKSTVQLLVDTIEPRVVSNLKDDVRSRIQTSLSPESESHAATWYKYAVDMTDKLGLHAEAEPAYRMAIEIDPRYVYSWNGLGNLLQNHLGRYEESESAYRKAIEIDPRYADAWYNLGVLLQNHSGRYEESESAYRKAIEIDPRYAYAWNNLGYLFQNHLRRYEESESAYRKAIEIDQRGADAWYSLGNLLQDHLGRHEESESTYRKAIEIDPRYAAAWNNLGNLLQNHLERYEESESAYRKAIEIDPRKAYPWNNLGNLLQNHLGRYEESESAYRKAIEIDPRYADAWNGLGSLYCDFLRRYSDAASAYASAIEIDSSHDFAVQNLVFLQRDFMGDNDLARQAFESLQTTLAGEQNGTFHLQQALFAAYDANWGLCKEALARAIDIIGQRIPPDTADDWFRASAVLVHLNYAGELLDFLRQRADDARMRPWFEALAALHRGDRRFLQNIPVEVRATAEYYFDQIEKRLNALPEKTRRRPRPKPPKKRQRA